MQAQSFALLFTVAMLTVTAYFLLGSVPLLVLRHDNPMDARFIRSFYITYYRFALLTAVAAATSHAWAGRPAFASGAAAIAILTVVLWRSFIPRMDQLGGEIQASDPMAIPGFRRIHKTAIGINFAQLLAILGSLAWF